MPREQRRLAAIMSADVVGYSRLMGRSESGTLSRLKAARADVMDPMIADHGGRIVKTTGDGLLVEFSSAVDAVRCGVAMQSAMAARADGTAEADLLRYRVGVHVGDIIIDGDDIFGDGVNVAARIEGLAEPGGVAISDAVFQHVRGRVDVEFADRGEHEVKNIDRPLHVWGWDAGGGATAVPGNLPPPEKPSIAVLPFDNMSGDPEQGYFADGITEDIITDLSKVSGLFVIARNSTFAYKGQARDVRKVSRELGVRYVLEGSVRRAADRIRINAQMVDGDTGGHLWAERYDRGLEDIFAVQDEVTRTIVGALRVKLTAGEEAERGSRGKISPEAYDLLVRARQTALQLRPEAAVMAREMLERVIALDSGVALAYARLSIVTFAEYANRWNAATPENLTRAMELARKAIETDETEPQGHIALALALSWLRRPDEAEVAAERAVELDPNSPDGYTGLGNVRDFQGRHEDAVALFQRAYRLDPQWDMALHFMGRALLALDRFDEAEAAFKRRLTFAPRSDMSRFYLACLYGRTGRLDEARAMWNEVLQINPNFSIQHLQRSLPYADPAKLDRLFGGLRQAGIEV
ncbi:MAG TPA: adenylate/guanylate cyclase domain-containing protein [Propylenella sp.]